MVKVAYSSGKPAYGVGAGNAAVIVDETADLCDAATKIRIGKTGDNASGCSAENSLIIQESIYDKMLELLKKGSMKYFSYYVFVIGTLVIMDQHITHIFF
jgi:sulfoacetaldehyde dehydrogenase